MKDSIRNLVEKYSRGAASEEEIARLVEYYDQLENEADGLPGNDAANEALKGEIRYAIEKQIAEASGERKIVFTKAGNRAGLLTAAALLLLAIGTGLYPYLQSKNEVPGATNLKVIATAGHYKLPDGTEVELKGNSKLSFPISFEHKISRMVSLEGEAFFDVFHDARKKFIVQSGDMSTVVLGTAFQVRAWPKQNIFSVRVSRGLVKVETAGKLLAYVRPAEKLVYGKEKKAVVVAIPATILKEENSGDEIPLQNVSVQDACGILEKSYGVAIDIADDSIRQKRFTAVIGKNEPLVGILERICAFQQLDYQVNEKGNRICLIALAR